MSNGLLARLVRCGCACAAALSLLSCGAPANPQVETTSLPTAVTASISGPTTPTPEPLPPNAERNGRAWGPADAPIKVLKFIDFQCPTCAQYARAYEPAIIAAFAATNKVRFEIRILTFIGPESYDMGLAGLCAADQNAFWPMYRALFSNQPFDGRENTGQFTRAYLRDLAAQVGLDTRVFGQCLDADKYKTMLDQDRAAASQYGVGRVPALVVNGKLYDSARSADDLRKIFAEIAPEAQSR